MGGGGINQIEILQSCAVVPQRATKQKEYLIKKQEKQAEKRWALNYWGCCVSCGRALEWMCICRIVVMKGI